MTQADAALPAREGSSALLFCDAGHRMEEYPVVVLQACFEHNSTGRVSIDALMPWAHAAAHNLTPRRGGWSVRSALRL